MEVRGRRRPKRRPNWTYRRRGFSNLLRMGHCAPAVMRTLLDAYHVDAPWLVRLVAGLPGGIGNCRNECGGITAPLVLLGLRHARDPAVAGVPVVVCKGQALWRGPSATGTAASPAARNPGRGAPGCPSLGVVRRAPEDYLRGASATGAPAR